MCRCGCYTHTNTHTRYERTVCHAQDVPTVSSTLLTLATAVPSTLSTRTSSVMLHEFETMCGCLCCVCVCAYVRTRVWRSVGRDRDTCGAITRVTSPCTTGGDQAHTDTARLCGLWACVSVDGIAESQKSGCGIVLVSGAGCEGVRASRGKRGKQDTASSRMKTATTLGGVSTVLMVSTVAVIHAAVIPPTHMKESRVHSRASAAASSVLNVIQWNPHWQCFGNKVVKVYITHAGGCACEPLVVCRLLSLDACM